jgi:hypothetical protein
VTRLVGAGIDAALSALAPLVVPHAGEPAPRARDALVAALNGAIGDHLAESGNPLAIEMALRRDGRPLDLRAEALRLAFPHATGKLLVLVHGSCLDDRHWSRGGHDHGAALARDLDFTPVYLHYNTGLHVSANGRAFAGLLEQLVAAWPTPVERLVLLAHSMGGLVARSASHVAEAEGHAWRRLLRAVVCVGTPHHGAPLERAGHWIDLLLGVSRYSAPLARLGKIRSAGVTDMRHGNVLDAHWRGRDRFSHHRDDRVPLPLPRDVRCYAIAGTTTARGRPLAAPDRRPRLRGERAGRPRDTGADARVPGGAAVDRARDGPLRAPEQAPGVRQAPLLAVYLTRPRAARDAEHALAGRTARRGGGTDGLSALVRATVGSCAQRPARMVSTF